MFIWSAVVFIIFTLFANAADVDLAMENMSRLISHLDSATFEGGFGPRADQAPGDLYLPQWRKYMEIPLVQPKLSNEQIKGSLDSFTLLQRPTNYMTGKGKIVKSYQEPIEEKILIYPTKSDREMPISETKRHLFKDTVIVTSLPNGNQIPVESKFGESYDAQMPKNKYDLVYNAQMPNNNQGYNAQMPNNNQGYNAQMPNNNQGYIAQMPNNNQGYIAQMPNNDQGYNALMSKNNQQTYNAQVPNDKDKITNIKLENRFDLSYDHTSKSNNDQGQTALVPNVNPMQNNHDNNQNSDALTKQNIKKDTVVETIANQKDPKTKLNTNNNNNSVKPITTDTDEKTFDIEYNPGIKMRETKDITVSHNHKVQNDVVVSTTIHTDLIQKLQMQANRMTELLKNIQHGDMKIKSRNDHSNSFDDIVKKAEEKKKKKEEHDRTSTTKGMATVTLVFDETAIKEALKKDPYVQRILKLSNYKKRKYMKQGQ